MGQISTRGHLGLFENSGKPPIYVLLNFHCHYINGNNWGLYTIFIRTHISIVSAGMMIPQCRGFHHVWPAISRENDGIEMDRWNKNILTRKFQMDSIGWWFSNKIMRISPVSGISPASSMPFLNRETKNLAWTNVGWLLVWSILAGKENERNNN